MKIIDVLTCGCVINEDLTVDLCKPHSKDYLQGEKIMGMYTHVRGWISLNDLDITKEQYDDIIAKAEDISPRSSQCITCTVFHLGFNLENYIFIGGEIKNYDNDWDTYLDFIFDNFDISDCKLEMKYEEDDEWTQITKANTKGAK